MSGITSASRSVLLNLGNVNRLAEQAQLRVTTGRSINSASDDAAKFFRAQTLSATASNFSRLLGDIKDGTNTVNSANDAISSISSVLNQLRNITSSTTAATTTQKTALNTQFRNASAQILTIINTATYGGVNLLQNQSLTVNTSPSTSAALSAVTVSGVQLSSTILGAATGFRTSAGGDFSIKLSTITGGATTLAAATSQEISLVLNSLTTGIETLTSQASTFSVNATVLNTLHDFSNAFSKRLENGATDLLAADISEEGAKLVALQTRQQLGLQALSFHARRQQAILSILT